MSSLNLRRGLPVATGLFFIAAGIAHFVWTDAYARIVPGSLPAHRELVLASGIAEMLGGVGIMLPATRTPAGWGLIALLVAVYPANIGMAIDASRFADVAPVWALWARLPLQFVAGWLVVLAMRTSR